jgi:hypothetical protein
MFNNILGKSKKESNEDVKYQAIREKISKMNLLDMRVYVNNKLNDFKVCEDGLSEIMRRLTSVDANGKRFIESDAMDSKKKKAFDLVILISKNKKITIVTTELIQKFIEMYSDIITKFDTDHKQIYASLLKDSLNKSIMVISSMADINKKAKVLG